MNLLTIVILSISCGYLSLTNPAVIEARPDRFAPELADLYRSGKEDGRR